MYKQSIISDKSFKEKYIKYKNKYIEIKKNYSGGAPPEFIKLLTETYNNLNIPQNIIDSRKYDYSDLYKDIIINIDGIFNKHIQNADFNLKKDSQESFTDNFKFISTQIPNSIFKDNQDLSKYEIINNVSDDELYAYVILNFIDLVKNSKLFLKYIKNKIQLESKLYDVILNIDIMNKYKKYFKDIVNHQLYSSLENNIILNSRDSKSGELFIDPVLRNKNRIFLKSLNVDSIKEEIIQDINTLLSNSEPKLKFGRELTSKETIDMILLFYIKYIDSSYIYHDEPIQLDTKIIINHKEYTIDEIDKIAIDNNLLKDYHVYNINSTDIIQIYIISRLLDKFNNIEIINNEDSLGLTKFEYVHKLIQNKEFMCKFIEFIIELSIANTYSEINKKIDSHESNHKFRLPNNAFIRSYDTSKDLLFAEIITMARLILL